MVEANQPNYTLPPDAKYNPYVMNWKTENRRFREILFRHSPRKSDKKNNPDKLNHTLRYQRMPLCGHKLITGHEPRFRNCESCWFTLFQVHGELTKACDEVFQQFGESGLRQLRGPKFTRNYLKFMSTLANWKKAADAAKEAQETNAQDSPATVSGSGGHTADRILEVSEGAGASLL